MCRKNQTNTSFCHDLSNYLVGLCDRQAAVSSLIWSNLTLLDAFLGGFLTDCTRHTKVYVESAGLCDLSLQFIQKNILLR